MLNIPNNIDLSGNNVIIQEQLQGVPEFYGVGECFEFYYLILEFLSSKFNELL